MKAIDFIVVRILALVLWAFGVFAALVSIPSSFLAALITPKSQFNRNLLISFDQLANTLMAGDPDETISSRAGKLQDEFMPARILCIILDKLDDNHCNRFIEKDEGKKDLLIKTAK